MSFWRHFWNFANMFNMSVMCHCNSVCMTENKENHNSSTSNFKLNKINSYIKKWREFMQTASLFHPGTTAHVGISLYGRESRSGHRHLDSRGAFARNALDIFHIATDTSLGNVWKIRIWHDNKGKETHNRRSPSRVCILMFIHHLTIICCPFFRSVSSMEATVCLGKRLADRKQPLFPGGRLAVSGQRENSWTGGDGGGGFR